MLKALADYFQRKFKRNMFFEVGRSALEFIGIQVYIKSKTARPAWKMNVSEKILNPFSGAIELLPLDKINSKAIVHPH